MAPGKGGFSGAEVVRDVGGGLMLQPVDRADCRWPPAGGVGRRPTECLAAAAAVRPACRDTRVAYPLSAADYADRARRPSAARPGPPQTRTVASDLPDTSDALLEAFVAHIGSAPAMSPATREAYVLDIRVLARWASARQRSLAGLARDELGQFLAERLAAGYSPSTVARQLTSFRRFFSVVATSRDGALPTDGLRNPARDPRRAPLLPRAALSAVADAGPVLATAVSREPLADYRAHRDHAIACLLMSTGMQVSAIRTLRWEDIDADWRRIRGAARTRGEPDYQLRGEARQALQDLRRFARDANVTSGYCFPGAHGLPLSRQGLCQRIRKFGRDLGLAPVVTPTALRRAAPRTYRPRVHSPGLQPTA